MLEEMSTFFFNKERHQKSSEASDLCKHAMFKGKGLGESYLYPIDIAHAKGETVNL